MPITVGDIVNALDALHGEAHYRDITQHILENAVGPFPADPQASVRARLQERCSDYKAYKGQADLFESDQGTGIWRFRVWRSTKQNISAVTEERLDYEAFEGTQIPKSHLVRERDPKLVAAFKATLAEPHCEACGMNFEEFYGPIGASYIEAHHKTPVALIANGTKTTIEDLAALCANCHRMIHKNFPMTVEELANILALPGGHTEHLKAARRSRTTWREAVEGAIQRMASGRSAFEFSRQDLITIELQNIVEQVESKGETPAQTLSRVLQELREAGVIEFLSTSGLYRVK